jgi:hypothetical protein
VQGRPYTVFVSYARHDEAFVKPLGGLLGAVGQAVFLDVESIMPGEPWRTQIENAVRESSVFIVCWCCQSKRSKFVQDEIEIALEQSKHRRIVPVLLCSARLPKRLADRQWIDLRGQIVHPCNTRHRDGRRPEVRGKWEKTFPQGVPEQRNPEGQRDEDLEQSLHIYYEGVSTDEPFQEVRQKILDHIRERRRAQRQEIDAIADRAVEYFRSLGNT